MIRGSKVPADENVINHVYVQDLIQPALVGTVGILKAVKKNAPSVKTIVRLPNLLAIDFLL